MARVARWTVPCRRAEPGPVRGKRGDPPADVRRRLGNAEVRRRRQRVAPVLLGDPEVLEHPLRPQPARRDRNCGRGRADQLGGQAYGDPFHRRLDQVVVETNIAAEVLVVLRGSVGHLHDQARLGARSAVAPWLR